MSDTPDPFEAELYALRPREVSPGFQRRVAERLAASAPAKPVRRWLRRYAISGGLVAGFLGAMVLWWGSGQRGQERSIVVQPPPAPAVEIEEAHVQEANPTLLAYQRALARSPRELDALLNRQALSAPEINPALAQIRAFTRSDAELHALLGDD